MLKCELRKEYSGKSSCHIYATSASRDSDGPATIYLSTSTNATAVHKWQLPSLQTLFVTCLLEFYHINYKQGERIVKNFIPKQRSINCIYLAWLKT